MLQTQELPPAIRSIAEDVFVFHQDNAPAHLARDTVELLRCETPQFITPDMWPANSCDLNLVDYCIWDMMQKCVYTKYQSTIWTTCGSGLLRCAELQHSMVDNAISQWYNSLEVCIHVHADCGHFCCDFTCLKFKLPHNATGCFYRHQCRST